MSIYPMRTMRTFLLHTRQRVGLGGLGAPGAAKAGSATIAAGAAASGSLLLLHGCPGSGTAAASAAAAGVGWGAGGGASAAADAFTRASRACASREHLLHMPPGPLFLRASSRTHTPTEAGGEAGGARTIHGHASVPHPALASYTPQAKCHCLRRLTSRSRIQLSTGMAARWARRAVPCLGCGGEVSRGLFAASRQNNQLWQRSAKVHEDCSRGEALGALQRQLRPRVA